MEGFELIKQGAEARIYKGLYLGQPALAKLRFEKKYRHPELDQHLTKERMKAECRAMIRCMEAGIMTPTLYLLDQKRRLIFMEYLDCNVTAKEFIQQASVDDITRLSRDIGGVLAKMHSRSIIHGDLTTSNMLLVNKHGKENFVGHYNDLQLFMIDFGLAHTEVSAEDKAVDLYVLERALVSIHENPDKIFESVLNSYKDNYKKGCAEVMSKLEEVRARGRKRTMVG